jgi:hypothetical protein
MNQFVNKTNDPGDSAFDLEDFVKNVTGKNEVGDIVAQFTKDKSARELTGALGNIFK